MNWFDIAIIIIMILSVVEGYRRGFFKEIVKVIGTIIILYLSFILMNPLGSILFKYLPFFSLHIIGIEVAALNILLYQIISFILIAIILYIILQFILTITGILSKIISATKVLKLPLKILGALVGLVSGYILIFAILFIFSMPLGKIEAYRSSSLKDKFLNNPIFVTKQTTYINDSITEIYDLAEEISNDKNKLQNSDKYNVEVIDIMLKNKVVSIEAIDELVKENKIQNYKDLENVLAKYRKDEQE